jgi:hypothetical protein
MQLSLRTLVSRAFDAADWVIIRTLTCIMHHAACFCTSVEQMRAGDPSGWIGVRPLAVQRVWY